MQVFTPCKGEHTKLKVFFSKCVHWGKGLFQFRGFRVYMPSQISREDYHDVPLQIKIGFKTKQPL